MKKKAVFVLGLATLITLNSQALTYSNRMNPQKAGKCQAISIDEGKKSPIIDGNLNDPIWQEGSWYGNFVQHEPFNGRKPSQKTAFKIAYDDNYLYLALKMYDTEPDKIVARVSRRDNIDGDKINIAIDSYYDKRTAFVFGVNAAGVKEDLILINDGDESDSNWDPIWWVKTQINHEGWCAEIKIPLNQLRFVNSKEIIWGLQIGRYIYRLEENNMWIHIPKDVTGLVHHFGELHGLKGLTPKRQVEIAPYVVAQTERMKKEPGNPFVTGKDRSINVGVDAKIGLTNNFTLDLTVNPDFGQVEADPSVVNLSAFETYFEEKRPFFIEGGNLLSFSMMFGDGDMESNNLFYSRRIGRSPQLYPNLQSGEYAKIPTNTTILGAAKITGRTDNGLSVGILESITANTYAKIDNGISTHHQLIEPLTNYTVASLKQEYNNGNSIVSGIFTSTNRQLTEDIDNILHRNAFTGGVDFQHMWANKKYQVNAKLYFSHVTGTKEAILLTQQAPSRYFQRPDNTHATIDSSRTSLTGSGGLITFGKFSEGHLRYSTGIAWRSPQLEVNDIGYTQNVDDIFHYIWVGLRYWEPFLVFRNINVNINQWVTYNFGGQRTMLGGNVNSWLQFTNYWRTGFGVNINGESLSATALRGGPMLKLPGGWRVWGNIRTDSRKKLTFSIGGRISGQAYNFASSKRVFSSVTYRPSDRIKLSLSPSYTTRKNELEYVTNLSYGNDTRYIRGTINQQTLVMSLRLEYCFNPDLSIQYYGRPYFTTAEYKDFKYITNPKASEYSNRFNRFTNTQIAYDEADNSYNIDENGDGTTDYSFANRNFNFISLQSNMIIRWEYRPGSTLFLVWTLDKRNNSSLYSTSLNDDIETLYDIHPHNIFLVKFTYRFN